MRSCAQINEISLGVEGNLSICGKVCDQFHFVGFFFFCHEADGLLSWESEAFEFVSFLDDPFHLFFQLVKVLSGKWFCLKVIVEAGVDCRPDCQFGIGKQMSDSFSQYMGAGMADNTKSFRISGCENVQAAVLVDDSS